MIEGKYCDHLVVDKDFQPVFNEEVDRTNKNLWKSFIPHENFLELLERVIKALEREKPSDIRSIWLFGSYGTGKTHAVFVLKHLLEDDDNEIEDYINKRDLPKLLSDRVKTLRQRENILIVFKSGAGHVDKSYKLLLEVQDAIYKAYIKFLKQKGMRYSPTETEIQLLKERLNDEIINWESLIKKYKVDLKEIASLDDLKRKLSEENLDLDFIERLLEILEKEGITTFKLTTERLKDWIKDIFNSGHVSRILFIWDEFSGFFKPGAPLDTLQELAHLTQEAPFYLLIVTHRRPEHWSQTLTEDVNKLKDRFHYIHYTMEPITVYELISNVVYPANENWEFNSEKIWLTLETNFSLQSEAQDLLSVEENTSLKDFKKLIPMHPYSAFLSSRIVEYFGSSQRTLFQFLKYEEKSSFLEFLKEYPKDDYYLLTPDFLWDYFFVYSREINEFHPEVLPIVNYWNSWKDRLENVEERRVFKVVMLLIALNQKIQTAEKHLRPLYSTIKLAFSGVPIYKRINQVLENLAKEQALRELKTPTDKEYWIPTHEIDPRDLERAKRNFSDFNRFVRNIEDEFKDLVIHRRAKLKLTTSEEVLSGRIPKVDVSDYQIGVTLVLMKTLERVEDIRKRIKDIISQYPNTLFVLSYTELGEKEWSSIVENLAYEDLLKKSNKENDAQYYRDQIESTIRKWLEKIRSGRFSATIKIETEEVEDIYESENVNGVEGLKSVFKDVMGKIFAYGFDKLILNEPLWRWENNKIGLEIGLLHFKTKASKGQWRELYDRFVIKDRILDDEGNFTEEGLLKKNYPLCKMREVITRIFEENESIPLTQIWDTLQKTPFGLYNSPLGSFVLGILMREYSKGYFATDGVVIEECSPQGMVKYLIETIKGQKEWILLKISPEHEVFCNLMREVFKLSENETKTPKNAIIYLRNKIKSEYKYPLWILKYALEKERTLDFDDYTDYSIELLDLLDSIVKALPEENARGMLAEEVKDKIKEFVDYIQNLEDYDSKYVKGKLERFADPEKFKVGFEEFVSENFFDKISDRPEDLSLRLVDRKLRDRMQEEPWAWNEKKTRESLGQMAIEFEISKLMSEFFRLRDHFIDDLCDSIKKGILEGKILPLWFYKYHPEINQESEEAIALLDKLIESDLMSIQEFNLPEFLERLQYTEELLIKIFSENENTIKSWLRKNVDSQLSEEELEALLEEIRKTILKKPEIKESQLLDSARKALNELKINVLRNELRNKLEEILGHSDVAKFYRESIVPVVLVKYLPEFTKFELSGDLTIDGFLRDLINFDKLQKDKLEKYLKIVEDSFEILKILRNPETPSRAFRAFVGNDWIEGLFNDDDLLDLRSYLLEKLGKKVELWDEKRIRETFEEWRSTKYKERFYPRLTEIVKNMGEKEAKGLVEKIIEYPEFGLKIMELLGEVEQRATRKP